MSAPSGRDCALATGESLWKTGQGNSPFFVLFPIAPSGRLNCHAWADSENMTIEDEFVSLLQRRGNAYDPRYVWD